MKKYKNFDLTNYNSYRIKSYCSNAYFPENETEFINILKELDKNFILLGTGHNVILSKTFYEKNIIILNKNFSNIKVNNDTIFANSGATMIQLNEVALSKQLSGLEVFYDIPSSLGGAIVMNAGASGEEIKDLVIDVKYIDINDNKTYTSPACKLDFSYRNSLFQNKKHLIVLGVNLKLKKSNHFDIKEKMLKIKDLRWKKQPRDYPNAGSVFKRPKGRFVGPMLDELKLKGYSVGGAMVSKKHSGFIVNFNNASGEDILTLVSDIQQKVFKKFKVKLELEQRVI